MRKKRVLWILNNVPQYRNVLVEELAKYTDLTLLSYDGAKKFMLKNPESRIGYKYIELKDFNVKGLYLNPKEFIHNRSEYDIIILGFDLKHPFRMLNALYKPKNVIFSGIIFGKTNSFLIDFIRSFWLNRVSYILVYSDWVKEKIQKLKWKVNSEIISYNNTDVRKIEMKSLPFDNFGSDSLNILWIGRYQKRKQLHHLIELAKRNKKINIKLVGPKIPDILGPSVEGTSVELFEACYGKELETFFQWSDIIVNPGHVGLLAMNAGKHRRAIVVGEQEYHAPEIQLVRESNQWMIDFSKEREIDEFFEKIRLNKELIVKKSDEIFSHIKVKYTVEYSVQQFMKAIELITKF